MDLFHLINSSEGFGSEDVDLDVLDGFGAFIGYLSAKIFCFASHSLAHATASIASWGSSQLPIHHCGICEHLGMEGGFLMAWILLLTPRRYSLLHALQQCHRWTDEE
jgi:hypothetical protein